MDNVTDKTPLGWAEILYESLAEIVAGLLLFNDQVHGMFREAKAPYPQLACTGLAYTLRSEDIRGGIVIGEPRVANPFSNEV